MNRSKSPVLQVGTLFRHLLREVQGRIDMSEGIESLPACPVDDIKIKIKS
jgi:hypothetical protein